MSAADRAAAPGLIDAGFFVGLDLGQADDFTAIVVAQRLLDREPRAVEWPTIQYPSASEPVRAERRPSPLPEPIAHYHIRHIERVRRVPYPAIVDKVLRLLGAPELAGGASREAPQLVVDATGVGRPVVDLFRKAGLQPVAVTITGGNEVGFSAGTFTVPKRDLVGVLVVKLQSELLKIQQQLPDAGTLTAELMNFRTKINPLTAHDSYNAREGAHDDLVLAAALAVWQGERRRPARQIYTSSSYVSL